MRDQSARGKSIAADESCWKLKCRLNADLNKQRSEFPDDLQTLGNIQHSKITRATFNTITLKQIMKYAIGSHGKWE